MYQFCRMNFTFLIEVYINQQLLYRYLICPVRFLPTELYQNDLRSYQNKQTDRRTSPLYFIFYEDNLNINNEELNDLYSSPNIVRVIKSRRMR